MKQENQTELTSASSKSHSLDQLLADLSPKPFGRMGRIWTVFLILVTLAGGFAYWQQLRQGLSITGMGDYATWGIYISNFVFFVAISLVGSLISAILKLTNASWRTPLTRISEIIAVAAIFFASLAIVVDMGRPDRILNVIFKARIQSPITWDVIVISTYLVVSILLLYLPMIPDLALLRDRMKAGPSRQQRLYRSLAINWRNTPEQQRILNRAIRILAIMIIPIAFGIHTVTSWLFATTLRPGWDSTNFGPYFVSGAFMVGAAAVIAAMYIFRRFYGQKQFFTDLHFDHMGKLLVLLSLVYLYFNVNEYFIPAYKMKAQEAVHLNELFYGEYAPLFWAVQIGGMVIPIIVLLFQRGRKPLPIFIVSIMVVVGAWFKRFLIVIPTLAHPLIPTNRVPEAWVHYNPTVLEWLITFGTLSGALLIITLFVRLFPIVPIVETAEESASLTSGEAGSNTGKQKIEWQA